MTLNWDREARRYVEHEPDTELAMTTFGPLGDYGLRLVEGITEANRHAEFPSNDNRPTAGAEGRSGWTSPLHRKYVDDHPPLTGERKGDWMQLYSGKQFWPMDPRADEVEIEDIAHSLSMQCRYAGHCKCFYSVAEHSVHLARYVSPENALWALLHDASEAYLVDVPRPVKPFLAGYKEAERCVMDAVCDRFGLPREMPAEVHSADTAIIGDERINMAPCVAEWYATGPGLGVQLQFWPPEVAEIFFLDMFSELTGQKRRVA